MQHSNTYSLIDYNLIVRKPLPVISIMWLIQLKSQTVNKLVMFDIKC